MKDKCEGRMKVIETHVRRLEITGVPGLDPIQVMLEDIDPGWGRIVIECFGKVWSTCWGSMGKTTRVAEFVAHCDLHYVAGKVSAIPPRIFDRDALKVMLKQEVISDRKRRLLCRSEARRRFDQLEAIELPETAQGLWHVPEMEDLLGPEWWYRLPEKANPDYVYLTKIIEAVQQALKSLPSVVKSEAVYG